MRQISRELLADAPRVWVTVGPDMRVRIIDPESRARAVADLEAAEIQRLAIEKAEAMFAKLRIVTARSPEKTPVGKILEAVCDGYGITRAELISCGRSAVLVDARTEVAHRLRERGLSLSQIGRVLERDHTTVLHALKKKVAA